MKTAKFVNRLMIGSLLLAAGVVASCGETGFGTSGIDLTTSCSARTWTFTPGTIVPAGFVYGSIVMTATKTSGINRTDFGNDTVLDSGDPVENIPAAGAAIYLSATLPTGYSNGVTDPVPLFALVPIGASSGELLPTVFFTGDSGRLELQIQAATDLVLESDGEKYESSITSDLRDGSSIQDCTVTIEAKS